MTDPIIHTLELKEAVLHQRLCHAVGVDLPYILCLAPGRIDLTKDVCSYYTISPEQASISRAKVSFKHLLRTYNVRWRTVGVNLDMTIGINEPMRQQYMLASMEAYHAQRLEQLFQQCMASQSQTTNLLSETFDPHLVCGRNPWLFEPA